MTIKFPVLSFCHNRKFLVFISSKDELTTCTSGALRNGYFNNLMIVDTDGRCFQLTCFRKLGYVGRFLGFSLLFGRRWKIAVDFAPPSQMTLQEFKQTIWDAIDKKPDFWASETGSQEDMKAKVAKGNTFQEIIEILH